MYFNCFLFDVFASTNLCIVLKPLLLNSQIVSNSELDNSWRQLALEAIVTFAESGNVLRKCLNFLTLAKQDHLFAKETIFLHIYNDHIQFSFSVSFRNSKL